MCYWVGTKKVRQEILRRFNEGPQDEIAQLFYEVFIANNQLEFKEHYVAIGKGKPTLTTLIKEEGNLQFRNMQWTLPYSYVDSKTGQTITRELQNSTCERVFFQHKDQIFSKRCLIPIDGYFEYYHFKGDTYPYYIYPRQGGIFYAGGIWEQNLNHDTGEVAETFSIITTPPNPLVAKIHNNPKAPNGPRMLLLIEPENALTYLNENLKTNDIKSLFLPYSEQNMQAHTVLRFQRKENLQFLNTPIVLEYCEYPELVA
ncbi:MAG: SOS response-associated peptidase family protein [Bacteroidota bacterium]|nr:SOS response-associated peptidase family protein [Bacteroidota bacterium]